MYGTDTKERMDDEFILLSHGAGAGQTNKLIRKVFSERFHMPEPLTDSAILQNDSNIMAFTTDSYVVDPVFFPGGDIGKLAVCGTVNDLAVSGANPVWLSASFIIEEGFSISDLVRIAESMSAEADKAGVKIATGDTKVVGRGKCDKLFITTSGIGFVKKEKSELCSGSLVKPGDKLIVNGNLGDHAIAILGTRGNLNLKVPVVSDCASLNHLIFKVMEKCHGVKFMRDLTRGGLAAVLNELFLMIPHGISVTERDIPSDEAVKGVCELLGFDPVYLANEGKLLIVADPDDEMVILETLLNDPLGRHAAVIGEITSERNSFVLMNTKIGGKRIIDLPTGMQIPRIC